MRFSKGRRRYYLPSSFFFSLLVNIKSVKIWFFFFFFFSGEYYRVLLFIIYTSNFVQYAACWTINEQLGNKWTASILVTITIVIGRKQHSVRLPTNNYSSGQPGFGHKRFRWAKNISFLPVKLVAKIWFPKWSKKKKNLGKRRQTAKGHLKKETNIILHFYFLINFIFFTISIVVEIHSFHFLVCSI